MDKIIMPRKDGPDFTRDVEDSNKVSDGYHTFGELYDHRISLFIALGKIIARQAASLPQVEGECFVWKSKKHSDGEICFGTGTQFILGLGKFQGGQMTYHISMDRWEECNFAETLEKAPEFDGHTSEDVLERLKNL